MTAPRAREQHRPPSPGRPSLISDRIRHRPAGLARLRGARRALLRSARALAAAACLALFGALALPSTAEAQTPPVCDRTEQVRDEIVAQVPAARTCVVVTDADLAAITSLDLNSTGITSLKESDFSGLTALTVLNLDRNSLSDLPEGVFDGLTALTVLHLSDNPLSDLQAGVFDGLTALDRLVLVSNSLSNLPAGVFDGLTALTVLELGNNSLSDLPAGVFDGLTALRKLFLINNSLRNLPAGVFDGLTALRELSLAGNSLSDLPAGVFDGLTALETLDLYHNSLSNLQAGVFDGLTALRELNLYDISLSNLQAGVFDGLTALTVLNLYDNSLSNLQAGVFNGLTALESLWLNDISLSNLQAGVFDGLTALETLSLGSNSLITLPDDVFDDLTALTVLNLSSNSLTTLPDDVFDGLTSLDALSLAENNLIELPDGLFDKLTSLMELVLHGNPGAPFAPTASARPDDGTISAAGGTVTLDGSGSGGAWGTNVTYSWALTNPASGVTVAFDNATRAKPVVTIPALTAGTALTFTLTVTGVIGIQGGIAGTTDTAKVTVVPAPAVLISGADGLKTGEDGTTATFQVRLAAAPANEVTVTPSSSDTGEGTVSGALTFNTANWNTARTVTATGVDDADLDGEQTFSITFRVESTDPDYAGISVPAVSVTNVDDESLALNLDAIAGDDTVNIAEKVAGFAIGGDTGSEAGVAVSVTIGTESPLTATSDAGGAWSVSVPPGASYLTGTSVAVTVSASKTGYTAPSDVTRALAVDLAAPSATYTAPSSLQVGVAVGAMTPSTTDTDIASYGATGLPPGLGIDTGTGVIDGTPDTADANTADATVTVTDTAGNTATVDITFPAVGKGDQTLTGFAYSPATVTYGDTAPAVTAPGGVQTTLSYAATPAAVCTVDASTGALTPVEVGACVITATAAGTADWNQATATVTVTVAAAGALALNLDAIAGDDTVNIAEKAAGFAIGGGTGTESGVSLTVTVGSTPLTATSGSGGTWSVAVPADAAYITGTSVAVTVSASKTGYTAPSDVTRALAVDLTAPSATYTAPSSLQVGVAIGAMTPSTTATDIAEYGATGLPPGLGIDTGTGVVSGTPDTADTNTASATVTVTDTAGNPATVSIAFPAVAKGDQTLTGFAYSAATVTYGGAAPTLTAPGGVQTTLTYAATPATVCTVDASTGALTLVEVGACVITATAAGTADWNQATATVTVTVQAAGALALNLDAIAGDDTVNIAEKAAGFAIGGGTGTESGVSVTVTVGTTDLTATSAAGGAWSVSVPPGASYLTGTSVAVTVSASKTGYTAPSDVTRALAVDLAAPTASYTAPGTLKVGVAVGAMTPSTTATDIASYGATGLPPGLGIDTGTGVVSGTPDTADTNTASATVTVTDTAGNRATVSIAFPAVSRGDQTLTGFAYSAASVTFGGAAPAVTAPGGVQTTLTYAATPATVCTVHASTGALTPVEVGACVITATAAGTADWNQATATFTVTVQAAGVLALNLDTIAGDDTVSIAEKAAGFAIGGGTGTESGVSVTVTVGTTDLTATSAAGGAWSVSVPPGASYLTGTSVAVTVSASKTGYTPPSDVTRALAVDLTAPSATYTAPSSLQVGVAIGAMTPSTTATDIAEYGATGLPPGLGIDTGTGVVSGTPDTADTNTASATVTVTDTAGNTVDVSITFPAVAKGDQTLTGFAYSAATVTYGGAAPTLTAPGGVQTTLTYAATPATVCTVDASTGALTPVEVGACVITATAAGTADWNQATATFTVTVQAAGALALNLDTIAGDDTVNIAEKAAGFAIGGGTGTESGVSVTVTVGTTDLTATSAAGGAWSVSVPPGASYLTGTSVAVTVSASKTGYTPPSDVTRALAVDLTAPSATYTAPSSLQVGVAIGAMTPSTTATDIAEYGATGLPPGLGIDTGTGVVSGTPDTADANTADATVTVTDTAGNPATVSIAFPAVARGDQTLTGFAYSAASVTFGGAAPAVTAPGGVQTTLTYAATPATVCTVHASTGALTPVEVGACVITATAAGTADWNQATATFTVTVQAAGALALNLDAIAGDDTVNIAEKAAGFAIGGGTGTESGVSLTVTVGSTPLTATSGSGGAWSVAVPADAAYITGTSVAVTVSASKTGYTPPSDVTRALAVDLTAPSASYTAPGTLKVGVAVGAMTPSTTATDIAEYGATGLPSGLGIDTGTGVVSGTPDTADANTASATVTVTDTAGNTVDVSITFPAVARGDQTLTGFAYSSASVTFGGAAPAVTAPGGVQTTLSYSATPATVCTVDASTGALTPVEVGACVITATAAGTADWNQATATFTVTVQAAGVLALNLDTIAGDDTVSIAEKAAGFAIGGGTGTESGVSVTVTVGTTDLTATSAAGGAWSVSVPPGASYLTGTSVAVTVSASKTGYTAPSDVTRALAVDLAAPTASYTAPGTLKVGVAVGAMTPSTTDTDIASYGATGLPPGLGIDTGTGVVSGTPDTADTNTASATVTVTDTAGNPATVSIAFPAVARGDQTLTGFAYSAASVTFGGAAPAVTAPGGVQTTLSYSATPATVCTVDASTGALTLVEVGACVITATAADTADWNQATATFTVTVQAAGALALNLDAIAGDDTVNIAEKAAGFAIGGGTGTESGVSLTVTVGSTPLTATSGSGGTWSVAVPADAAYITGTSVAVTVSASKTGYTPPSDVTRALAVDLTAPSASYTAPGTLKVGVAVGAMTPSTTATDIAEYGATGLPPGLGIDTGTGVVSGTPDTADANTASATVTVTDTAGNTVAVPITFPAVARGDQTLTGFAYSSASVTFGGAAPAVTAPGGVQTTLSYSATPATVCTVDASTGALTLVEVGACNITATAAGTANYNEATAASTVTVQAAGVLALNLDTIAGDDTVNIAEKAAGFAIGGDTGTESGVSVTVTVGTTDLTATSAAGGAWSVSVPPGASYLTGTSVAVTVSASKTGYTPPSDVTRALAVDLTAPSATYTAPSSLQVGVAVSAMTPSTTATDIASYGATGLPPGLGIDTGTGVVSGTPDTADTNTASATVTVTDTAGNPATVSIAFPAVARGDQTLTGFAYSAASVTYGGAAPAVTAPGGVQTTLSYSATPATVCTVDASTGALTLVEVGACVITATAADTADWNQATATFTVTVQAAGALALNLDAIAGDDTVNIAEKAAGFAIGGDTGTESGVSVTVTVGTTGLTATSAAGGAWSVSVPPGASYLTGTSVAVTVSASKTGYTPPSDVTRALAVDLTAPSASYTAPGTLKVGVAVGAMTPSTTATDIASYGATGLPPGLGIDTGTGVVSGTPDTADTNTASATVTVTDTAGNPATVSIAFPAVARGNQTLTGFAYSAATVTYGDTAPTVTAPSGVQTTLSYSAKPSDVCTVDSSTGALTLEGAGSCAITVTAAPSADYNRGTATYTVTVAEDPEGFDVAVSAPAALDEDAGAAAVTVTLMTRKNRAPLADIDMYYVGKRGETATRGADYTPPPGRDFGGATGVFFATVRPSAFSPNAAGTAWVAEPSFTIGIIDDQKAEVAETIVFTVALGVDRSPAHTITIRDNDAIAPGSPTGLKAAPRSPTVIQLSWTAPENVGSFSITGYKIEVSADAGGRWSVLVPDTRKTRPSWGHGGLSPGDTRHYRVSAISPAGTSGPSNVASATTIAAGPAGTNAALPPPTNVGAVPKLPGEIRLSWWRNDDVPSHELVERHQYRYRVHDAGTWTVDWTTVNQTLLPEPQPTEIRNYNKVLLQGLTEGTTYEFQVRSVDTDGGTSAAVAVLGTATGRQTVWIVADVGSVAEGEPLRFTLWRDHPHGPIVALVRISETGDMLPPEGRSPEGLWHQQVHFGDGNEEIPLVLDTVHDGSGPEPDSIVTVEVISYPLYPDNPDNDYLYEVQPDVGPAKITVTAAGGSSAGSVAEPLTATFEGLPEAHDGETAFSFRLAFSEAVAVTPEAMRTRVLTVAGGSVTGAARVDGESGVWEITVTPDIRDHLSITLAPAEDCEADGAVCTSDGRTLSVVPAHIVIGPGPETQTPEEPALTASFEGLPEVHDGEEGFHFRVAFSEEIGIGFRSMRDDSFAVDGGEVTGARRVDGRHDLWEITVEPDSDEAITFALPGGRECAVSGAICTRGENRRRLTNTPTATVAGPAVEPVVVPLTASFVQAPYEHDGKTAFKFRIAFSEGISIGFRTFRDQSLSVSGGSVTKAKRVDRRKDLWEVTVEPGSLGDVTVTLAGGRACGTAGAVCTGDGRALSATISTTVLGPVALSVADARVREASDVTLDFAVTLSRASRAPVAVAYATADGSATAGSDYTATSGTLTFAAGETSKTVSVPVLDDAHDEGEETLTLRLSAATGAVIADGVATGTIENTDHMPAAWLARFGRTVTDQVLEAVEARLAAPRATGARATLAGQTLPSWDGGNDNAKTAADAKDNADARESASDRTLAARDREAMTAIRDWMAHAGADGEWRAPGEGRERANLVQSRALTGRDFLTGTSFALTGGSAEAGGYAALWGRGAISRFDGREGDLTLDGEVTTGLMGADWAAERWTAGLAIGHARGTGGYSEGGGCTAGADDNGASGCSGEVEATLTGVWPYAGLTLTDRLSAWAAAGYGAGSLTLTPGGETDGPFTADLTMTMGAAGMRGEVLTPPPEGGLALALKGDARLTRTASEATKDAKGGNLAAATADVWLVRTGIEGSRRFAPGGAAAGLVLTPSFELGVRLDGGDAETGLGVDLGGELAFAAPKQGVALDLKARGLVAHEAPGFREWGASASLAWDPRPSTDRGLALTLRQSWGGSPTGGMDALLGRETLDGLAANENGDTTASTGRLEAELGYGIAMFEGGFTGTPHLGVGLSETGRDYRLGWRLTSARRGGPGLEIGLAATRSEAANDDAEHGIATRGVIRW